MIRLLSTLLSALFCFLTGAALLVAAPKLWTILPKLVSAAPAPLDEQRRPELAMGPQEGLPQRPEGSFGTHSFPFHGKERVWLGLGPAKGAAPRPVVILLHAQKDDPLPHLAAWEALARREGFTVITAGGSADRVYIEAVLEQAQRLYAVDPTRVYLFGHGAGATDALQLAGRPPAGITVIAVQDGALESLPEGEARPRLRFFAAEAPAPLASLGAMRDSANAFLAAGYPVALWVRPAGETPILGTAPAIAEAAWRFFEANPS